MKLGLDQVWNNAGKPGDGVIGISNKMDSNGIPHHSNHEEIGGGREEKAGTISWLALR